MGQDLTKEELWNIKRFNQRAKSMGGEVRIVWDKNGEINKIYVAGVIEAKDIYTPEKTLDHPDGKKGIDAIE